MASDARLRGLVRSANVVCGDSSATAKLLVVGGGGAVLAVLACVCTNACVRACVRTCVRACVRVRAGAGLLRLVCDHGNGWWVLGWPYLYFYSSGSVPKVQMYTLFL